MKVFAYLRVSTKEQLEGGGFERQLDSIKSLCASRGYTIARTFRDQQSGGTEFENRAGLQELLSLAGEKNAVGIDTVVVEDATRIARDLMVQEIFLCECRKRGIKVIAADSGHELVMDGAEPTRVLIRQILGALAQWEKATIVVRLQAGRRKKARETGKPCGGPGPYGATSGEKAVIGDIMKLRNMGFTYREISEKMNTIGYPTPRGGPWHAPVVRDIFLSEKKRRERKAQADDPQS